RGRGRRRGRAGRGRGDRRCVFRDSGSVDPAGPVTDVAVPRQVEVDGFTYELDTVREVSPGQDVQVGTGEDVVVMLVATGLGDGSATLSTGDVALARVLAGQERSVPVTGPHGLAYVSGDLDDAPDDARIGVAVYRPTDELANGFSHDTAVFRSDTGDRRLLNAAFIQDGESSATVVVRGRLDDLTFSDYCSTTQPDLQSGYDFLAGVLLAGDRYDVSATPTTAEGRTALLVYRPV
ncbi:hypothetical protein, partial [Nocardioides sp.]|uniref:hypothetical protein n=1 Tax=Nocardioides sp. TaxID=35761 RepID=UPI00260750FC